MAIDLSKEKIARLTAEFLGVMFFIMTIRLSASLSEYAPFAIGTVLMVVIYQFGWISGGHMNPAVSLAIAIRGNVESFASDDYGQIGLYWLSQLLGSVLGGILGNAIGGDDVCVAGPHVDEDDYSLGQGFLGELMFTFLLTSVVLHTGTHQNGNQFYALSIGFSLFVGVCCIGDITGCCVNPSVWFGLNMAALICDADNADDHIGQIWLYWGAHILAATMSGLLFRFLFQPAYQVADTEPKDEDTAAAISNGGVELTKQ